MSTESNRRRTASSSPRGLTPQQRMEEARKRRAEALAHKEPANDDARLPPKPAAKAKKLGKISNVPGAPKMPTRATSKQPPAAETPTVPVSKPLSEPRFPEIIMPEPLEEQQSDEKPRRRFAWLFPMIGLLVALLIGTLFVFPKNPNPSASFSVTEPLAPDQLQGNAQGASARGFDARPDLAKEVNAMSLPTNEIATYPVIGTAPSKPSVFSTVSLRNLNTAEPVPNAPAILPLWLASTRPANLTSPTRDPLFALPKAIELKVALVIPAAATNDAVNAVTTALDKTGFEVTAPRRVSYVVKQTQVRYFHEEDAEPAGLLADAIGGTLRDFTDYSPSPPTGLVEVFVAGRAPAAAAQSRQEPRGLAGDLRQFGTDLRNALSAITR